MLACGAPRFVAGLFALVAVHSVAPVGLAAQSAPDDPAYRAAIDDAVHEFAAGRWEEARALFKRAHEISPNARTLRGMGMTAFELRMYVQSIRELDAALRDARKPLGGELRAQVQQLVAKAREFVGRVTPVVDPPAATLLIDGQAPVREPDGAVLLDAGAHVISATLDGYKPTNVRLSVEGGSDQTLHVPLEPLLAVGPTVPAIDPHQPPKTPEPPQASAPQAATDSRPARPAAQNIGLHTFAWISLIGAAGFGTTAGVLHFAVGDAKYRELERGCGSTAEGCSDREIADSGIETTDALTHLFLGLSLVSGLTAGVLFAIEASRSGEQSELALEGAPGAVRLKGRF
jgi:hypothetical protein